MGPDRKHKKIMPFPRLWQLHFVDFPTGNKFPNNFIRRDNILKWKPSFILRPQQQQQLAIRCDSHCDSQHNYQTSSDYSGAWDQHPNHNPSPNLHPPIHPSPSTPTPIPAQHRFILIQGNLQIVSIECIFAQPNCQFRQWLYQFLRVQCSKIALCCLYWWSFLFASRWVIHF